MRPGISGVNLQKFLETAQSALDIGREREVVTITRERYFIPLLLSSLHKIASLAWTLEQIRCSVVRRAFTMQGKPRQAPLHPTYLPHPHHHARLVMNRHFYGHTHGLPLQVLDRPARSCSYSDGVVGSVSQHARIFDDQLLVLSVISTTHLRGDSVSLRSHIDSYGHSICEHLTLSQGCPGSVPIQLSELAKKQVASCQFQARGHASKCQETGDKPSHSDELVAPPRLFCQHKIIGVNDDC
jgi:hypothetical protein